jgi:hemoglobin-like flavoprotein
MSHPIPYAQRERIKASLPLIRARGLEIVEQFYKRLFEKLPEAPSLFAIGVNKQRIKFYIMLREIVMQVDNWPFINESVKSLGRRHQSYGVQEHHYEAVGIALIEVLSEALGKQFTEEDREAWTALYREISACMLDGYIEKAA